MKKNKIVGKRIRELRERLRLTQGAFVERLPQQYKITQSALSHIESGGNASLETLTGICEAYNLDMNELIKEEDVPLNNISDITNKETQISPLETALIAALDIIRGEIDQISKNNDQWVESNRVLIKLLDKAVDQGLIGPLPIKQKTQSEKAKNG
jgi:transcriptional regulator with XRE-family HTH domain